MLLLRALSARSYTRITIAWKVSKLHGYRAENAMKHPMMPTCSRGEVQDWKARAFWRCNRNCSAAQIFCKSS